MTKPRTASTPSPKSSNRASFRRSPASGGSLNNVNPNPITSSVNNVGTFTNRGTTYGDLTVTKTVVGGGDPSGFYFVATNSPAVAGCTSSAVATSVGATATFSNLVDMLANGTACTYVVTEIPREGFSQTGSTVTATNPAVPAVNVGTITNTPVTTATGQFTITKTVNGSASVEGWVFIAEADIPGCTDSAVATTDVSGIARFEVMTETAGGTPCTYTVTEIPQAGYVQTTPTGTITGTPTDTAPYPNTDVMNAAATTGTIDVTKSVVDENGDAVPTANINADWTFVLSTTTADSACTQGPVYAVTDSNGDASFDVVAMTPTGTTCQYAIVEIAQPGYTQTQPSPDLTDAEAGDTVAFVNQELLEMGSFKVEKEVYNSSGVIDTGLRGGWTFIASGNEPGCTPTAVATTDSTGIALFDVIKTSPSGTACTYTVTEAVQAGYTVSGVPATGDPHSAAIPKITNRADATATYGSIVVDKAVETADGTLLTDPSDLEGWAITASSGQSGCTTTAVTLTDTTGIATFDGLVMETADGTICEYTISEQVPDGYDVTVDPTTPVLPEDPAPAAPQATVTNAEIQTIGEFSIQKTVQGGDGDPSNWVFVAASSQEGCTQTAVATTDGSGLATFTVVDTSATGDACAYEVTEILKDGYVNTVAPPTAADPDAVGSGPTYDVTNVGTTTGTITVDKTVVVNGSQLANGDPLNGGWIFTLVNDPALAGCTAGPVYAITDANGDATFPDVVDTPAGSNTACEYTVTEVEQVGYEVDANPATGVAVGGDAPFQNTQNKTLGSLSVSKSVTDGLNQPAPAERAGWTFVVSSTQEGCTASATAVTDSNGDATFPNLIDVNANGETCVYDVDEVAIPGYTVSGDVPTTGQEADGTDLVVMNTADPIATESSVIVYKNVDPSADPTTGDLLEGGTDSDALLGNWVFTLTGTAPCTTGPVYAITDNNGVAVFSDLIDMPPGSTTPCEYTVTEVTQAGYAVTPSASQDTVTGATPVVFTNTENQTLSGFDIQKIVLDPAGDPVADASGWTFIATSTMAGCSNPAVAVTGTDGLAHFENIVDINADGDQCEYSVTEAPQAGYSTTDALPLTVNPDAVNNQTVFEDQVTNKADTVSTYGDIVITKSVYDSAGTELTSAEDRSGWIMHAANSPVVDGCTTSATAVTDSNGVAWFTGLVKTTADGDDCTYVITEAPEPGYTVAGSPTAAIAPVDPLTTATRAATPDITNTEKIAYGSITAHKDLYDEHGDPVTAPDLAGWTFVAISETPGCTSTAVQTTDGDGNVTFTDLIATNTDGVPCTYTIDETRGPGYTVTDAPLTAIQPTSPTPADAGTITNTLTPKATTGDITVDKTVIDSDNQTVTDGDARKGGWLFVLTGTVDGCTTGPVYALTDTNGDATFTGVIDIPAGSDTPCEYTITEVEQAGYDLTNSPAGTISVDGTAAFENSQNQTLDSLTVQKTVVDGLGNTITSGDAVSGWTFVASSDQDGCTTSQLAITGTDGTATFPNLIDTNADGDTCVYDIDEVELPGYTISGDVPATDHEADGSTLAVKNTADPIATESSVIVHKNVSLSDGTNLLGATDNDDLLGNWVFTLTAADGQPTDCTQGPVYAITNNDGIAVFTNLIENTPADTPASTPLPKSPNPGLPRTRSPRTPPPAKPSPSPTPKTRACLASTSRSLSMTHSATTTQVHAKAGRSSPPPPWKVVRTRPSR
ncbi:MAG: Cna B-type domain-containing protein [Acidimicrobiia bacterium]|nr:Cna B-type domain-containing protein [Acidimicrobiia bacterium]